MKSYLNPIIFLIVLLLNSPPAELSAQVSAGGLPYSFSQAIPPDTVIFFTVTPPSMDALTTEDEQSPMPYRFAVNLPVDLGTGTAGQWIRTTNGIKVWRLNIKSPGAKALILYFDRYKVPDGGKFFVYNPKRTQLLGAFTSGNNNKLSTFATGLIYGDEITLEYNAPEDLPLPDLHVSEVGHAYRGVSDYTGGNAGFGGAGPCEVNVNCAEGVNWQKQKRSVTRITVKRGGASVWCTGSLVDNTRHDGKPYVLTADHCGKYSSEEDLSKWIFYFNYEGTGCPDPTTEPELQSITGATLVAHGGNAGSTGSDFYLVLLNSPVPFSYNAYYAGWSRETVPPSSSGTSIHHPQGDIKKISTYTKALQPAHWVGNPALAHWRVYWSGTVNGHGTTEGGSSGSPLYDSQGLLVGTLTGGDSSCDSISLNSPDYYGMFSYHWDQNGTDSASILKCWLDPDNTGLMTLKGWAVAVQETGGNDWVSISPNPVVSKLTIKSSANDKIKLQVSVYDMLGNQRFNSNRDAGSRLEEQVDMTGFASGMYLLVVSDGDRRLTRKIVKL